MESGLSKAKGATKDCQVGDLMTHPAFLSIPSNGFWVGKFETGYNQNSDTAKSITDEDVNTWTTANAQVNEEKPSNIIVKPTVYSWRSSTVKNFFMNAYNFNRTLDSHMMKNTEWGAVAYLSHSKYGIQDDIRENNNNRYLTGYGSNIKGIMGSDTNNSKWNTDTGHLASTTGNISGVYDMSGGAYEYMASYREESDLTASGMESIINDETYIKYLDKYFESSDTTLYKYRILGDATGELGPFYNDGNNRSTWYADLSGFVNTSLPWFIRGGGWSSISFAGHFYFSSSHGGYSIYNATRLILNP